MRFLFLALIFLSQLTAETSLSERLKEHIFYDPTGPNVIGHIAIDDRKTGINQSTWIYVKKALDHYKEAKPRFILLELNTPGGEIFSSQLISDALKELDTQFSIPVVAYINNWAISAGAMLAYSSRFITVVKDGSMGAAEPVQPGETGQLVSAPEKVNSALRTDFANRASFFDRDPNIAIAMVDKDTILVWRDGKVVKLDKEDQVKETDTLISAKGKLLTLSAKELIDYGVADLLVLPIKSEEITAEEKRKGQWPASKVALFHTPFFRDIPNAVIDSYQMDWKTQALSLLANPVVSSFLFLAMVMGFYMELNTPGFGFPGSLGLIALFLILLSSFALEAVSMLEVILLLVGAAFVLLDLILIPTFGLLGVVGALLFIIGLFGMMLPGIGSVDFEFDTQTFNAAGEFFIRRLAWLGGTLIVAIILVALMARYMMPSFRAFQRFVLAGHEQEKKEGYVATESSLPRPGAHGVVLATLRPTGKVMIEGEIYDAISRGDFIEKGSAVTVIDVDESVLVVEK